MTTILILASIACIFASPLALFVYGVTMMARDR